MDGQKTIINKVNASSGMGANRKLYEKKSEKRKLFRFMELSSMNLAWGASLIMAFVLFICGFDFGSMSVKSAGVFGFGAIFLAEAIIMYALSVAVRKNILTKNEIVSKVRLGGYICILFTVTGNIFASIAGFTLIKRNRSIEYTLCYYAFLNNVFIMLLSLINIFKPYVSNYFMIGMSLLAVTSAFYILSIIILAGTEKKGNHKNLKPLAAVLILSSVTGNLFGLLLGAVILSKIKHVGSNKTIGWIDVIRRIFRNYMAVLGIFIVIFLLTLSLCSYLTFDYSYAIDNNYSALLRTPSIEYPFGTDSYGRCVYSRIAFGARISLIIGMVSTAVPFVLGGALGAVSGYYGNQLDNTIMRVLDVVYAVPSTLLTIAIVAAFGANTLNLILALSIGMVPVYARTMRAQVMVVSNSEFVEAARACGRKKYEILMKHIVPNSMAPMIVRASLSIGVAVLSTSSLSYLGLGVEPHIPEWGNILKGGSAYLETNPYLAIYPGLAIILVVLAFNFFGDGLRDALDPKLK